jgi:hypothetical protein
MYNGIAIKIANQNSLDSKRIRHNTLDGINMDGDISITKDLVCSLCHESIQKRKIKDDKKQGNDPKDRTQENKKYSCRFSPHHQSEN